MENSLPAGLAATPATELPRPGEIIARLKIRGAACCTDGCIPEVKVREMVELAQAPAVIALAALKAIAARGGASPGDKKHEMAQWAIEEIRRIL